MAIYGAVSSAADFVSASAAFVDVAGLALNFRVEEDEMQVLLNFQGVVSHSAVDGAVHLQFDVDGNPVDAAMADGQYAATSSTADALNHANFSRIVSLSKGHHVLKLQAKTPDGASLTLENATWPGRLSASRLSHDAVLAHGVDSKVQAIF